MVPQIPAILRGVPSLDGIGNKGSSCTSQGIYASCSAIWKTIHSWSSLEPDAPVPGTLH